MLADGASGLEGLTYAVLLCLLPRMLQDFLAVVVKADPHPLVELLIGMMVRMGLILGGTIVICLSRPDLRCAAFFVGLALCYVVTLVLETWNGVQESRRSQPPVAGTVLGG